MKEQFAGFYGPSEKDIDETYKDPKTMFIFDTNILLSLYRCEESTRIQFLNVWENLKDQVWIPFHVCLEYQRNRLIVIHSAREALKDVNKSLNSKLEKMFSELKPETLSRYSNLRNELNALKSELISKLSDFSDEKLEARRSSINFINEHDDLRDKIDELISGRIGKEPISKQIEEQNKSGTLRYKYKTGPGFADAKNKQDDRYSFNGINYDAQYSDLYIWMQILEEVKSKGIKKIVYVTNDEKEDFFYKINNKIRGPVESLVTEIKREANADIFLLHQIDAFLHHAVSSLNAKIDDSSITELAASAGPLLNGSKRISFSSLIPGIGSVLSGIAGDALLPHSTYYNNHDEIDQIISSYNSTRKNLVSVTQKINELSHEIERDNITSAEKDKIMKDIESLQVLDEELSNVLLNMRKKLEFIFSE